MSDSTLYLLEIPAIGIVSGRRCAYIERAIVATVAGDPEDPGRVLVRVVDGLRTGLRRDALLTVGIERLLSRAQAEAELALRRGADRAVAG